MKSLRSRTAGLLDRGAVMRRPRNRQRKVTVTPELVELFRRALAADQALDSDRDRRRMTPEQHSEALAAVHEFHKASNHPLWERHSVLSPEAGSRAVQEAVLAELSPGELKRWQAYVRRYWRRHDADMAEERAPEPKPRRSSPGPRLAPNLKWGGHW